MHPSVLAARFAPGIGSQALRAALLVVLGVGLITLAAKIRVPMWPVPVTMGTFAVLTVGALYGLRLSVITLLAYLALGAAGVAVFAGDTAGLVYMTGPTGGYLLGYLVAAATVGWLAERGWSRSVPGMIAALLLGNALIYAFGLPWMAHLFLAEKGAAWVMQWGMTNFLLGDLLKLMLAAMVVPVLWRLTAR